jgi:hypothetical protein
LSCIGEIIWQTVKVRECVCQTYKFPKLFLHRLFFLSTTFQHAITFFFKLKSRKSTISTVPIVWWKFITTRG